MNRGRDDYDRFKRQWRARHSRPNAASNIKRILRNSVKCVPPQVPFQHLKWTRGSQTLDLFSEAGEQITQLTRSQARRLNTLGWLTSDCPVFVFSGNTASTLRLNQVLDHMENDKPQPTASPAPSPLPSHVIDAFTEHGGGGSSGYSSSRLPPVPGTCARCGRYCDWPTYYNNLPYGSYCIQKVRGW